MLPRGVPGGPPPAARPTRVAPAIPASAVPASVRPSAALAADRVSFLHCLLNACDDSPRPRAPLPPPSDAWGATGDPAESQLIPTGNLSTHKIAELALNSTNNLISDRDDALSWDYAEDQSSADDLSSPRNLSSVKECPSPRVAAPEGVDGGGGGDGGGAVSGDDSRSGRALSQPESLPVSPRPPAVYSNGLSTPVRDAPAPADQRGLSSDADAMPASESILGCASSELVEELLHKWDARAEDLRKSVIYDDVNLEASSGVSRRDLLTSMECVTSVAIRTSPVPEPTPNETTPHGVDVVLKRAFGMSPGAGTTPLPPVADAMPTSPDAETSLLSPSTATTPSSPKEEALQISSSAECAPREISVRDSAPLSPGGNVTVRRRGSKEPPSRRVSFKVRAAAAARRTRALEARGLQTRNSVALLTTKFQMLISEGGGEGVGVGAARRATQQRKGDGRRLARKLSAGARRAGPSHPHAHAHTHVDKTATTLGAVTGDKALARMAAPEGRSADRKPGARATPAGTPHGSVRAAIRIFENASTKPQLRTAPSNASATASAAATAAASTVSRRTHPARGGSPAGAPSVSPSRGVASPPPGAVAPVAAAAAAAAAAIATSWLHHSSTRRPSTPTRPDAVATHLSSSSSYGVSKSPRPASPATSSLSLSAHSRVAAPSPIPTASSTLEVASRPHARARSPLQPPSPDPPHPGGSAHPSSSPLHSSSPVPTASPLPAAHSRLATPSRPAPSTPPPSRTPAPDPRSLPDASTASKETSQESCEATNSRVGNIVPNASFLWRAKDFPTRAPPPPPQNTKPGAAGAVGGSRRNDPLPPPPPPRPAARTRDDALDDVYDDVLPASQAGTRLLEEEEEDVEYQDVGPGNCAVQPPEDIYETCGASLAYDDCEDVPQRVSPSDIYQRLEDVVYKRPSAEEELYDDVKALLPPRSFCDETKSISNCYESINGDVGGVGMAGLGGGVGGRGRMARRGGSSASSSSGGGSAYGLRRSPNPSSCDQTNSLYERGSLASASRRRMGGPHTSAAFGSDDSHIYPGPSCSETSDEWMDVDLSDSESVRSPLPALLLQERSRPRKSPDWSKKVRNQWTKHQAEHAREGNMEDHNYETLDDLTTTNNAGCHYIDDSDSFDSNNSDCESSPNHISQDCTIAKELPEPPTTQNIYGISKIAEAAGKKVLEFGRSLRRIGSKNNPGSEQLLSTYNQSTVKPCNSEQEQGVKSASAAKKAQSTSTSSGTKTWTLRKFRRSSSSSSNSTFYLQPAGVADVPDNNTCSNSSSDGSTAQSRLASVPSENSSVGKYISLKSASQQSNVVRPTSPPPLPPSADVSKLKQEKETSNTSWYAECGLFGSSNEWMTKHTPKLNKPNSSSWYAAVGLWDSMGQPEEECPETDNSGNSEQCSEIINANEKSTGKVLSSFPDEPLYQFYIGSLAEKAQCDAEGKFDSDGYEEIAYKSPKAIRPTAMELIQPKEGQHRTLWCEVPDVLNSQVLSTLSPHQKKLQEAKFEIITSEASYMNSLNVLDSHFMSSSELNDDSILSKNDRRILFGNVNPVKKCCEMFLADLEKCWQDNILLHGICDTVHTYASKYFNVYIKYCSNQIYLDRTLRRLKGQHGQFADVLTKLEGSPNCQLLTLHSFLMLPMQRITRLPLLVDAVLTRLDPKDNEYESCRLALATLNKIVQQCNEGARRMERMEQILILSRQLEFPKEVKHVPIISSSRYLVRCGEVIQLIWRDDAKLTFGKKISKAYLHLFLFSDLLVIAKKKSEECYAVIDYCSRNLVQISCSEGMFRLPIKSSEAGRNLMILTMLQNHENKTVEMVLSCPGESDKQRWYEALSQPRSENPGETVYEEWDCPQVIAVHSYTASQPDELSLDVSDVVNVLRKMTDGWYQGERIRDGEKGWFPGNYCVEIASAHVRARNLKQRYRLLALSGNFLESQQKDKSFKQLT